MSTKKMACWIIACCIGCGLYAGSVAATSSSLRMAAINRSIAETKATLEQTQLDQTHAQSALAETEAASKQLTGALTLTQQKLTQTTTQLHDLQTQII